MKGGLMQGRISRAAEMGDVEVLRLLLARGGDVWGRRGDVCGRGTPRTLRGHMAAVTLLLESGAMQVTRTPGDSEDFVLDLFCDVRNSREIIILAREPWKIPEVSLMLLNEKQKMARDIRQAVGILAWRVCRPAAGEFVPCFRLVLEAALREHGHDRLLLNNMLWFAAGFASTDLLRVLVQAGARPDVIVHGHSTSLMTAITNGNPKP